MVEVAHGVKVPACRQRSARRYFCRTAPAKLAVKLSVWIAPLKEALTLPSHGQWQAGKRL
jgi:hypothetical protein